MGIVDHSRVCDLVEQIDALVSKEGALVVHGIDEAIDSGLSKATTEDNWLEEHFAGVTNQQGLLRLGIEHLKAAIRAINNETDPQVVTIDSGYLSDRCELFGYLVTENLNPSFFEAAVSSETFKEKANDWFWAIALILILAFLGASLFVGIGVVCKWLWGLVF